MCWLRGQAGTGKTTIAHTIAERCESEHRLAFSLFFSRRNVDRSDITKIFPTFAYQLAKFLPSIQKSIEHVLRTDPDIFNQSIKYQFTKLIIDPVLSLADPIPSMIVVIDGLDEYTGQVPLNDLICLLVEHLPDHFPFQFLLTSRPEPYIVEIFNSPSLDNKTYRLSLQDFESRREVCRMLWSELSKIRDKRNLPASWPSKADLENLAEKTDGLYIYATTLIRFIDDEYDSPQEKLQDALVVHRGVDPLYDQVLRIARKYRGFELVMGAIAFLRIPLSISGLGQLLCLDTSCIRLALRGCSSILLIPDDDEGYPRPYHASLQDFITDPNRAPNLFDPVRCNEIVMRYCMELIRRDFESETYGGKALEYACSYWCSHFCSMLSFYNGFNHITSDFTLWMESLLDKLRSEWLKSWVCNMGSHKNLEQVCGDLASGHIRACG